MFYNIYFTPKNIETINKALKHERCKKDSSLSRKFKEATRVNKPSPGYIIRISSEELVLLKSYIMDWFLFSDEDNRAMLAMQAYKSIIEDIAEMAWPDSDVEIS